MEQLITREYRAVRFFECAHYSFSVAEFAVHAFHFVAVICRRGRQSGGCAPRVQHGGEFTLGHESGAHTLSGSNPGQILLEHFGFPFFDGICQDYSKLGD